MSRALILYCIAVACSVGSAAADQPKVDAVLKRLASGEPTRIVCFGDSVTGAYYHTGGERAWCDMLGLAIQRVFPQSHPEMINAGISGNTTAAGLARMEKDVIAKQPHLVVVMFGMNDVARASLDDFVGNLSTIVRRSHASGAAVILCTPNTVYENAGRPIAKLAELSERVRKLAKEQGVVLA